MIAPPRHLPTMIDDRLTGATISSHRNPSSRSHTSEAALAALEERFGIEATVAAGAVTFHVESGEAFVPRLFAELGVPITSVAVSRPTLDDVFMRYTGSTIRDAETGGVADQNRALMRAMAGAKR